MAGVLEFVSLFLGHTSLSLSSTRCAYMLYPSRSTSIHDLSLLTPPVVTSCSRSEGSSRGYAVNPFQEEWFEALSRSSEHTPD